MVKGNYFESMRAYEKQEYWENGSGSFSLIEFCDSWASLVGGNFYGIRWWHKGGQFYTGCWITVMRLIPSSCYSLSCTACELQVFWLPICFIACMNAWFLLNWHIVMNPGFCWFLLNWHRVVNPKFEAGSRCIICWHHYFFLPNWHMW